MPLSDAERAQFSATLDNIGAGRRAMLLETKTRFTGERALLMAFEHVSQGRRNVVVFGEMIPLADVHARFEPPEGLEPMGNPIPPASGETT